MHWFHGTGFNNPGKEVVLKNLQRKREGKYILGVNINTNAPTDAERAMTDITGFVRDLQCLCGLLYDKLGQHDA